MLLAGEDTTSHTLAWASWFMAVEPRAQARLAAEADEGLGHRRMADDAARVEALPYAEAFLRETLRLRPAAPVIFVQALGDTRVADVEIPAGTRLLLLGRAAALHEANFSNPMSFEPERWLEPHEA